MSNLTLNGDVFVLRNELIDYLDQVLQADLVNDYCPNGLQVEGSSQISKMVSGVTASMELIDKAIEAQADTILVHHGYFWKGESSVVTGMKQKRLKKLLSHDINLIAYHLPIDIHPQFGNNAQLGKRLGITDISPMQTITPIGIVMQGKLEQPSTLSEFANVVEKSLNRTPLVINAHAASINLDSQQPSQDLISTIAWCTGGGQNYIDSAAAAGNDLFISGEISEQTVHSAKEQGIHYISAGHHATERYGAKAIGEHLAHKFDIDVEFIDCDNPA